MRNRPPCPLADWRLRGEGAGAAHRISVLCTYGHSSMLMHNLIRNRHHSAKWCTNTLIWNELPITGDKMLDYLAGLSNCSLYKCLELFGNSYGCNQNISMVLDSIESLFTHLTGFPFPLHSRSKRYQAEITSASDGIPASWHSETAYYKPRIHLLAYVMHGRGSRKRKSRSQLGQHRSASP